MIWKVHFPKFHFSNITIIDSACKNYVIKKFPHFKLLFLNICSLLHFIFKIKLWDFFSSSYSFFLWFSYVTILNFQIYIHIFLVIISQISNSRISPILSFVPYYILFLTSFPKIYHTWCLPAWGKCPDRGVISITNNNLIFLDIPN